MSSMAKGDAATYKQLGNGVNVGAAYHVLREFILANLSAVNVLAPHVGASVVSSPISPDETVERYWDAFRPVIDRSRTAGSRVRLAAG